MFKFVIFVLVLVKLENISGETDYCALESEDCIKHIGCLKHVSTTGTNKTYTIHEFSDSEKQKLLNFTNEAKNNVAGGLYEDVGKGSNVPIAVWCKELEYFAKRFLDVWMTDNPRGYCFVSDNLKYVELVHKTDLDGVDSGTILDGLIARDTAFLKETAFRIKISHRAKLACAFLLVEIDGEKEKEVVCANDYDMEPNKYLSVYDEGEPCSKCDSGLGCDEVYVNLCKQ